MPSSDVEENVDCSDVMVVVDLDSVVVAVDLEDVVQDVVKVRSEFSFRGDPSLMFLI